MKHMYSNPLQRSWMRLIPAVLLVGALGSCSLFKLKNDLEQLYSELFIISGRIPQLQSTTGQAIAVLTEAVDGDASAPLKQKLVDYRFPDQLGNFNFQTQNGQFKLFVFFDQNNDFIYQPGEQVAQLEEPLKINRLNTERAAWQFNDLLLGDADLILPVDADLSPKGLAQLSRTTSTMGVQIDFDAEQFSDEQVATGMWEPGRWLSEVGHGFYLTEPWDSSVNKPLLLLVHGINGSPKNFASLLELLDTSEFRVALYHYPSGMSIDDSAYILSQTINDMLIRQPQQDYLVVAHSMGGLVAKRFIHMQARAGQSSALRQFVSMSSPWLGHKVAETGLEYAPVVAPVWEDIAPSSEFIRLLGDFQLPEHIDYTLLFSHKGNSLMQGEPNDGVVALKSQLDPRMQDRAQQFVGVAADHTRILTHERTIKVLQEALARFPK